MMPYRFLILIPVISFILEFYTITAAFGADSPSNIELLKKISAHTIKEAIQNAKSLDEAAARTGVNASELKTVCMLLNIDINFPSEKVKPAPEPVPVPSVMKGELITDIILEYHGRSPYVLLVDKSEHKLYLLKYENGIQKIEQVFDCKTGKNYGDKQERGDHKTPEGVYFFTQKYTRPDIVSRVGKDNAFQYGEIAFVTDFPNAIDQLKGKNGGGIWLHGTDEPFEATPSLDTSGCVVTTNETIKSLSKFIQLQNTPLIVVDKLNTVSRDNADTKRKEILSLLENWRKSWAEKRIDDYINFYAPQFRGQGLTRDQWKERKAGLAKINGNIRLELKDFMVLKQKDGIVVQFIQDYSANNVSNVGLKTLYLIYDDNNWEITAELFRKTN
jgi:murein L,D-transpeptidase YafK